MVRGAWAGGWGMGWCHVSLRVTAVASRPLLQTVSGFVAMMAEQLIGALEPVVDGALASIDPTGAIKTALPIALIKDTVTTGLPSATS